MCDLNPLLPLSHTEDISPSSPVLRANRYMSVGFLAFMGLSWDLEPVLHTCGRQELAEKCILASFVV